MFAKEKFTKMVQIIRGDIVRIKLLNVQGVQPHIQIQPMTLRGNGAVEMIKKIETARIEALGGLVCIELEECQDGVLNLKIIENKKSCIRIGIPDSDGTHFKFLKDYKGKP